MLERDEVLLAVIQSFHSVFVYFFGHNRPGIRVFNLRLTVSEDLSLVSEFLCSARDLCHGKQRVSPFYHDSLTTTDKTTGLLLQIGSSSARIKERLTDGDVIVVEVIREPLLA